MTTNSNSRRIANLMIANGMSVLFVGLLAGVMLVFSLLGVVTLWPLPEWHVLVPGSTRGWQAAHVGGILNGVMISGAALLALHLQLEGRRMQWVGYGMILTGWANTVFYWAGLLAPNRGLSVAATPFGPGDLAGAISFLGGGSGMAFTFIAAFILAKAGFERARA